MLISYYAHKKSSPRLPSWQPSLTSFNTPIESGSIIKPCTLKHSQVPILAPGLLCYRSTLWKHGFQISWPPRHISKHDNHREPIWTWFTFDLQKCYRVGFSQNPVVKPNGTTLNNELVPSRDVFQRQIYESNRSHHNLSITSYPQINQIKIFVECHRASCYG